MSKSYSKSQTCRKRRSDKHAPCIWHLAGSGLDWKSSPMYLGKLLDLQNYPTNFKYFFWMCIIDSSFKDMIDLVPIGNAVQSQGRLLVFLILQIAKFWWMKGCLSFSHTRTVEQTQMKFGTKMTSCSGLPVPTSYNVHMADFAATTPKAIAI